MTVVSWGEGWWPSVRSNSHPLVWPGFESLLACFDPIVEEGSKGLDMKAEGFVLIRSEGTLKLHMPCHIFALYARLKAFW